MNKFTATCLLAAVATACLGTAVSASAQRADNDRIAALDTDGDKSISRDEASANPRLSGNFDAIDTDRNGKLSMAEMKNYAKANKKDKTAKAAKGAGKLDANQDGSLSREEVASNKRLTRNFATLDTNKDNMLSAAELKASKAGKAKSAAPMPAPAPAPAPAVQPAT